MKLTRRNLFGALAGTAAATTAAPKAIEADPQPPESAPPTRFAYEDLRCRELGIGLAVGPGRLFRSIDFAEITDVYKGWLPTLHVAQYTDAEVDFRVPTVRFVIVFGAWGPHRLYGHQAEQFLDAWKEAK